MTIKGTASERAQCVAVFTRATRVAGARAGFGRAALEDRTVVVGASLRARSGLSGPSMKRSISSVMCIVLLLTGACGDGDRTSCAIAKDAITQCDAEIVAMRPFGSLDYHGLPLVITDDCSGWNACDATCVKNASCLAMQLALTGGGADPNRLPPPDAAVLKQCLMRCYERFHEQ